jgi:hypothetical protein
LRWDDENLNRPWTILSYFKLRHLDLGRPCIGPDARIGMGHRRYEAIYQHGGSAKRMETSTCADAACAVAAVQAARKTDISAFETMPSLQDELLNRLP